MGFKRTSEGRVFFEGSGPASANDSDTPPRPVGQAVSQSEIVLLLKSLNERLKATQAERSAMRRELETYRSLIDELDQKVDTEDKRAYRAEQIATETLKELAETRKLLLQIEEKAHKADKGVNALQTHLVQSQQTQDSLAERVRSAEKNQNELTIKLEDTASQQARLVRKIDKTIEERARFMRKIERIEEAVLQTRDALSARAMVLLTDQGKGEEVPLGEERHLAAPQQTNEQAASQTEQSFDLPWWKKNVKVNAAGAFVALVAVILSGWFISEVQRPLFTGAQSSGLTETYAFEPDQAQLADAEPEAAQSEEWTVQADTSVFSNESQADVPVSDVVSSGVPIQMDEATDDIGALDINSEADILAALEADADALAARLNEIEPGSDVPEELEVASISPEEAAEENVVPEESVAQPEPLKAKPAPVLKSTHTPKAFNKPDSRLPDVVREIERDALNGVPEAQHDLAAVYTAGHGGVKQSYDRALYWFRQAADQGVANAQYNLGVLYHQGLGTEADVQEAVYWYSRAADGGHPEAQYNLGIAYIEGIGVPYDPVRASEYFEKAADQGIMEAAYNLGLINENGLLGQAKPDVALMWYKVAADQGSAEAKEALNQLAKTLNIKVEDINRLADSVKTQKQTQNTAVKPKESAPVVAAKEAPVSPEQVVSRKETESVVFEGGNDQSATVAPDASYFPVGNDGSQQIIVAQVQEYLMRAGLYPGPADGVSGPLTSDAIRSYQTVNNLPADGYASPELLQYMLANTPPFDGEVGSRVE